MILEKNTYENVKAMLESPDEENKVMGFQCLKQGGLNKGNLVYILFLLQEADITLSWWRKEVPEIVKGLEKIFNRSLEGQVFSFSEIKKYIKSYELSIDDYQFYMERFAIALQEDMSFENPSGPFKIKIKITKAE